MSWDHMQSFREANSRREQEAIEAHERSISVGDKVVCFKGRKVAKGTKGIVRWVGTTRYGWHMVKLELEGGEEAWNYTKNVKALDTSDS